MERIDQIRLRLTTHILEIGVLPMEIPQDRWAETDFPDPSNLHKPYGWLPPVDGDPSDSHPSDCACYHCREGNDPQVIWVPFCPQLIDLQSAHLDDQQFADYLEVIVWTISMQVTHRDLPWQEREALIDKTLMEDAAGSMKLLTDVQMAALDQCAR